MEKCRELNLLLQLHNLYKPIGTTNVVKALYNKITLMGIKCITVQVTDVDCIQTDRPYYWSLTLHILNVYMRFLLLLSHHTFIHRSLEYFSWFVQFCCWLFLYSVSLVDSECERKKNEIDRDIEWAESTWDKYIQIQSQQQSQKALSCGVYSNMMGIPSVCIPIIIIWAESVIVW